MDLFEIARANALSLSEQFDNLKRNAEPCHAVKLLSFAKKVLDRGCISINMRPSVAAELLTDGRYLNMHQWAEEQSALCGRSVEQIMREKLGPYHDRRLAFESTFSRGQDLQYGALNIGGTGTTHFGQFCVALSQSFPPVHDDVAYLKTDSLTGYVDGSGRMSETGLRKDVAPHSHRHCLAVLKHAADIPRCGEDEWANMMCSDHSYIEAIFVAEVSREFIQEIRLAADEYTRLWNLAFSDFTRELNEGEHALVHDFVVILRASAEHSVTLLEV